jgi:intracellular sulfur oxidation DsrE/DsrF family protein
VWARHGKVLDSKAAETPTANPFDSPPRHALSTLAKRGVQFIVCGSASSGIARRIAGADGDADATLKEMTSSMIPSSRLVSAGVVGVTHAQEYGFSLLYVG